MSEHKSTDEIEPTAKVHQQPKTLMPHDSNPFTTTLTGMRKLVEHNTSSLIGLIIFTIASAFVLIATVATVVATGAAYILKHTMLFSQLSIPLPAQFSELAHNMSDGSIISSCILGFLILIWIGVLIHILAVKLATSSSQEQTIGFGELLKRSSMRVLPLLGLATLLTVVIAAAFTILVLLGRILGPITFVLAILSVIGSLYVAIRLTFATFAVVGGRTPIASLRYSWTITRGHFFETLGVAGASAVIVIVPYALLNMISATIGGPFGALISSLSLLATFGAGAFLMAGFAERFVQLGNIAAGRAQATKTNVLNYLSIIIYIIVLMILGTISPHTTDGPRLQQYIQDLQQQPPAMPGANPNLNLNGTPDSNSYSSPGYNLN